ncbi:MAG: gephyrin-like molybdotransferase Glp [Pseudomonadota bacterium]
MISVHEALATLLDLVAPTEVEEVPINRAAGRVLAETVHARRTQPPFSASAMDGYAVRRADAGPGAQLRVIGEAVAGRRFDGDVGPGQAVRIFTGAPVPEGADDILLQEDATRDGDALTVHEDRDEARYIRAAGQDFSEGDPMEAPRRLGPADIALLAAMNLPRVRVHRRPVLALVPTGDELVMPGETPGPDQIVCSNNFGLHALLERVGAEPRLMPIARDSHESLGEALRRARRADLIVTLGGASVGDHDLVRSVAGTQGLDLAFYKVAMRPGKPLTAGRMKGVPLIGLPGNPVSAMVCGHIFLRPMVDRMLGLPAAALAREDGTLGADLGPNGGREHYMRARLARQDGTWICTPFERQDSALLSVLGQADALMVRQAGEGPLEAGTKVPFIRLT